MYFEVDENIRKEKFVILSNRLSEEEELKLFEKFQHLHLDKQTMVTCGVFCESNIDLNHKFEVLFEINNINNMLSIESNVRYAFALGKNFDFIPSGWNVAATFEFSERIPIELQNFNAKTYCLSSRLFWNELRKREL